MRAERGATVVVARETTKRAVRSGVLWGYIFAVVVASSALTYTRLYPTQADRDRLAASFGSNHAASALFGPAPQLQTVAGFTVFKSSMTLMILGAVWGLLTSTRLMRGEEDSGRWELLLSGQTSRRGAAIQALGGLAVGVASLWAVTAVVTALTGASSKVNFAVGAALYFAMALVATAVIFLAVGAVTSQLAATRRQAAGYAAAFLGVSYGLRMIADSGVGLHGLAWLSPVGWVEELQPLTSPRPVALLPIAGFTALLSVVAVQLAGRRDLGSSTLPDRDRARPHLRLLSGPTGLTIRLVRATAGAWAVAISVSALLFGTVAKAAGSTMSGSSVQRVISRLGAPGAGAKAYLGVTFLILAVLVGFVAAGQVTAARGEEAAGRLDHLLVRPVSRLSWLLGRLVVAISIVVAGGLMAAVFTWLGAAAQQTSVGFATLVGAGVNTVPPAIVILGVGLLAIGAWPRGVSLAVYGLLAWSVVIEFAGGFAALSHWLLDTSVFHQMASAPAVSPDWVAGGVMVAIGVLTGAAGTVAFTRRDLQGE
jgi:ABC-2 type transport system permease protein